MEANASTRPDASLSARWIRQRFVSRTPLTPGGYKGMGEGGTIGAPAAIANAVADAVKPLGVAVNALPILPADLVGGHGA